LTEELAPIRRRFGPEDLAPELARAGIGRTVLVQTRSSLDETRDFLATAASTDFVAGVVGWVDLTDPALAETLEEIRGWPGGRLLVGVRHQVHDEPDPEWLLRPAVQEGIARVGRAGLAYDLLVRPRELPAAAATVRRNPDVRFVVDHLGKPQIADGPTDLAWEAGLRPLAEAPNAFCKLSGMVTEADWATWTPADLAPYIGRALAWFGPGRCMFGSDWPVCLLAAGYSQVLAVLEAALSGLDDSGRARVLGGTAEEFYRLG
jgi:L-fuconolactonase